MSLQDPPYRAIGAAPTHRATEAIGGRRKAIGVVIALLLLAGLGGLTWYLINRPAATPSFAGTSPSGSGAPGAPNVAGAPSAAIPPSGSSRGATTVGVATAEKTSVPVTLDALGTVTPLATVRVRPQIAGVLEKVLFTEGQMVKKGDLLAVIDSRQYELAVQQANGQRQLKLARINRGQQLARANHLAFFEQDLFKHPGYLRFDLDRSQRRDRAQRVQRDRDAGALGGRHTHRAGTPATAAAKAPARGATRATSWAPRATRERCRRRAG